MIICSESCLLKGSRKVLRDTVSIIITNFKKEPYLKQAILSCLAQSHKRIEVIVVDDCSNKSFCVDLIRKIGDKRVRLISSAVNYGHYACCNYAIDASTGDYITFLGADDTISPRHIEGLLSAIKANNLLGACSLYSRFKKDGTCVKRDAICEASIMFHKHSFIRDIGYFHMIRCAADTEYRERALAFYSGKKIGLLKTSSYKALWTPGSLTSSSKTKKGSPERARYVKVFRKMHKGPKNKLRFDYRRDFQLSGISRDFLVSHFDTKSFSEVRL